MTKEQLIVLGFIAAAFIVGWAARALTGERRPPGTAADTGRMSDRDGRERPVEASRRKLEDAIDAHEEAVARASAAAPAFEATLAEDVGKALGSDIANDTMLGALADDRAALSDFELDLADWGFTYGVAWALARGRDTREGEGAVAREAFSAAEPVFRDYVREADWARTLEERAESPPGRPETLGPPLPNGSAEGRKARRRRLFRSRR